MVSFSPNRSPLKRGCGTCFRDCRHAWRIKWGPTPSRAQGLMWTLKVCTTCEGVQKKAAVTFELGLGEYLGIYILWEEGLQSLLIFRGDLKISSQLRIWRVLGNGLTWDSPFTAEDNQSSLKRLSNSPKITLNWKHETDLESRSTESLSQTKANYSVWSLWCYLELWEGTQLESIFFGEEFRVRKVQERTRRVWGDVASVRFWDTSQTAKTPTNIVPYLGEVKRSY